MRVLTNVLPSLLIFSIVGAVGLASITAKQVVIESGASGIPFDWAGTDFPCPLCHEGKSEALDSDPVKKVFGYRYQCDKCQAEFRCRKAKVSETDFDGRELNW